MKAVDPPLDLKANLGIGTRDLGPLGAILVLPCETTDSWAAKLKVVALKSPCQCGFYWCRANPGLRRLVKWEYSFTLGVSGPQI